MEKLDLPSSPNEILTKLQKLSHRLIPFAHSDNGINLDCTNETVALLCETIDMAFFYGIKIKEFNGNLPLWGMLERLEVIIPPFIPLRNTVGAIASIENLRNPVAKARGWIRQSLNAGNIDESVHFICHHSKLISSYYSSNSILSDERQYSVLIAILRSLRVIKFSINVDDPNLNLISDWMIKMIRSVMDLGSLQREFNKKDHNPTTFVRDLQQPPPNEMKRNSVDSFLRSFESGFDRFIHRVDAAAEVAASILEEIDFSEKSETKFVDSDNSKSSYLPSSPAMIEYMNNLNKHKKITPFFGSSLKQLVLDELRCSHANLDAYLGIPNQALKMINYISSHIQSPNLFRQRAPLASVSELKSCLEQELPFPHHKTDIATVSFVFIQWLNQLPEPLFGYEHYNAILACQELESESDRIRNLMLLLNESPWYSKPLLLKVISLFANCIKPENMFENNLNPIAVALLTTPFLFRPYNEAVQNVFHRISRSHSTKDQEEMDQVHMAATAAGSSTIEFIMTKQNEIFATMRDAMANRQNILSKKCARIRTIQEQLSIRINASQPNSLEYEQIEVIKELWENLSTVEKSLSVKPESTMTTSSEKQDSSHLPEEASIAGTNSSIEAILKSSRWANCGFTPQDQPLKDFNTHHGLVSILCLSGFIKKYGQKAVHIIQEFRESRFRFCSLTQTVIKLVNFTADVLLLLPTPIIGSSVDSNTTNNLAPISHLAKQPIWLIFSHEDFFQEVFDMAMLSFDDAWNSFTEWVDKLADETTFANSLYKTRNMLWKVILQKPSSIDSMWEIWVRVRVEDKQSAMESHVQKPTRPASSENTPKDMNSRDVISTKFSINEPHRSDSNNMQAKLEEEFNDTQHALPLFAHHKSINDASILVHHKENWEIDESENPDLYYASVKTFSGIESKVFGKSDILTEKHIEQIETSLPKNYQCYDWRLLYKLPVHGANLQTLIHQSRGHGSLLWVIRDSNGAIFGALITEQLKFSEKEKYYGNGTMGVWSFVTGTLQYYSWSYKNSYFLITSKDAIALGGGGNFAIYLDSDLNKGTSGPCETFDSPCLASQEDFICQTCELFVLKTPLDT